MVIYLRVTLARISLGAIQKVRTLKMRQFWTPFPPCTLLYAFGIPPPPIVRTFLLSNTPSPSFSLKYGKFKFHRLPTVFKSILPYFFG